MGAKHKCVFYTVQSPQNGINPTSAQNAATNLRDLFQTADMGQPAGFALSRSHCPVSISHREERRKGGQTRRRAKGRVDTR